MVENEYKALVDSYGGKAVGLSLKPKQKLSVASKDSQASHTGMIFLH